jgi:uncharacterized membrane protein HdeD (DUF308 family)
MASFFRDKRDSILIKKALQRQKTVISIIIIVLGLFLFLIVFDELDDLLNGDFDDEVIFTLLFSLLLIITGIVAIFRNYFRKKGYKNDKEFGILNKFFY